MSCCILLSGIYKPVCLQSLCSLIIFVKTKNKTRRNWLTWNFFFLFWNNNLFKKYFKSKWHKLDSRKSNVGFWINFLDGVKWKVKEEKEKWKSQWRKKERKKEKCEKDV